MTLSLPEVEKLTVLRCEVGSKVYGTNLDDQGDRDEMGVCVEPPSFLVGLERFEQHVHRSQPEGVRSGPGDLDLTIYSLRKFCSLSLSGNPTLMTLMYAPADAFTVHTEVGEQLLALAPAFVSRRASRAFLGYMTQQRERLLGLRGQRNVKRPELVDAHGFDTKYAGHMLRLGYQGVEYMEEGRFSIPMRPSERAMVLSVRRGDIGLKDVLLEALALENRIEELLVRSSVLPPHPDTKRVNEFLVDTYLGQWRP